MSEVEHVSIPPAIDHPVDVEMRCELSQECAEGPYAAALIRQETHWWDDDPEPEVKETIVCEIELDSSMPAVFTDVDEWLRTGHRLHVVPASWRSGDTGPGTGVVTLLEGSCTAADPTDTPPSAWRYTA